jgi:cytoskeleton protein RodZ
MKNGRNAGGRNLSPGEPAGGGPAQAPGARIDIAPPEIDIAKDHLGATLSARRHALGLRVEDVAEDIKVRPDYLRALEQEEMHKLPTPQHARLFVKAYAERLGLNVAEIYALHDLCESPVKVKSGPETPAEQPVKESQPRRRVPVWVLPVAGIAIVVTVLAVWILSRGDKNGDKPPPAAAAPPVEAGVATETAEESAPPAAASVQPMTLVLSFSRDTWAQVIADNDTAISKLMRAGERTEASARARFQVSLGHALGVAATLNGRPLTPLLMRAASPGGLTVTTDSVAAWFSNREPGDSASTTGRPDSTTGGGR